MKTFEIGPVVHRVVHINCMPFRQWNDLSIFIHVCNKYLALCEFLDYEHLAKCISSQVAGFNYLDLFLTTPVSLGNVSLQNYFTLGEVTRKAAAGHATVQKVEFDVLQNIFKIEFLYAYGDALEVYVWDFAALERIDTLRIPNFVYLQHYDTCVDSLLSPYSDSPTFIVKGVESSVNPFKSVRIESEIAALQNPQHKTPIQYPPTVSAKMQDVGYIKLRRAHINMFVALATNMPLKSIEDTELGLAAYGSLSICIRSWHPDKNTHSPIVQALHVYVSETAQDHPVRNLYKKLMAGKDYNGRTLSVNFALNTLTID